MNIEFYYFFSTCRRNSDTVLYWEKKGDIHSHTQFLRNDYANGRKALAYFAYKLCLHTWKEELEEAGVSFRQLFLLVLHVEFVVPHKTVES